MPCWGDSFWTCWPEWGQDKTSREQEEWCALWKKFCSSVESLEESRDKNSGLLWWATPLTVLVCSVFRVYAMYNSVKGACSEPVSFTTHSCAPECPFPPKLAHRSKSSLTLQWKVGSLKCWGWSEVYSHLKHVFSAILIWWWYLVFFIVTMWNKLSWYQTLPCL